MCLVLSIMREDQDKSKFLETKFLEIYGDLL